MTIVQPNPVYEFQIELPGLKPVAYSQLSRKQRFPVCWYYQQLTPPHILDNTPDSRIIPKVIPRKLRVQGLDVRSMIHLNAAVVQPLVGAVL